MPLVPELGFVPDLEAIDPVDRARAKLMYLNYPNNPTGAIAPEGFFERVVEFAREHEILVVHDNSYSEIAYDGHRPPLVPRDPRREGGGDRGVLALQGLQHDRLALRGGSRKRSGDRDLLAPEDEHRLRAVRRGAARGRSPRSPRTPMRRWPR